MSLSAPRQDRDKLVTPTVLDFTSHKPLTVILGAHTLQRREDSWQTFEVKDHVRPISFEKSKVRGGSECSVAGWGYRTATVTLREATVTVIRQRDCLSHYPGLLCAGVRSLAGDAGDPLVCNNKAYGIFSYRHNNWPGFYTHIAPFLPWVNSVMKSA
uniref:Granzyme E-like n=1 Tax=Cyanistes caeruleus TaxID=156563 RepID=A0A8C0U6M9_CYACU